MIRKTDWSEFKTVYKAVIQLSLRIKKSILKLTKEDYVQNELADMVEHYGGSAHNLNLEVFHHLRLTITGWPGGKPSEEYIAMKPDKRISSLKMNIPHGMTTREPTDYIINNIKYISADKNAALNSTVYPKRVIIFSPHPDDDVISMGGTLIRLIEQGHQVAVAYQTSGNNAVWDEEAERFSYFARRYAEIFQVDTKVCSEIEQKVHRDIDSKKKGEKDSMEVRKIKGLIRETEALAAARYCGVRDEDIHFLNLPFYETGADKKNDLSEKDTQIIVDLLEKYKPHQIYAAGDLSDPHGTHGICLKAIFAAFNKLENTDWYKQCQVWLYRGAWQEWEPYEITMAVPMSPSEMLQKRYAIFKHQSQKDTPVFPGDDPREFWQRSEARNRETARLYDTLGMNDYEGVEAFVLYDSKTMTI